jgi:hypothetical protein
VKYCGIVDVMVDSSSWPAKEALVALTLANRTPVVVITQLKFSAPGFNRATSLKLASAFVFFTTDLIEPMGFPII